MGVRIGDAQWSYAGFNEFRRRLAREEGIDLDRMVGFGLPAEEAIPWESVTTSLRPLLGHSDCDGDLSPSECSQVAPRLEAICRSWTGDDDLAKVYDRQKGLTLVREILMSERCLWAHKCTGCGEEVPGNVIMCVSCFLYLPENIRALISTTLENLHQPGVAEVNWSALQSAAQSLQTNPRLGSSAADRRSK